MYTCIYIYIYITTWQSRSLSLTALSHCSLSLPSLTALSHALSHGSLSRSLSRSSSPDGARFGDTHTHTPTDPNTE